MGKFGKSNKSGHKLTSSSMIPNCCGHNRKMRAFHNGQKAVGAYRFPSAPPSYAPDKTHNIYTGFESHTSETVRCLLETALLNKNFFPGKKCIGQCPQNLRIGKVDKTYNRCTKQIREKTLSYTGCNT